MRELDRSERVIERDRREGDRGEKCQEEQERSGGEEMER